MILNAAEAGYAESRAVSPKNAAAKPSVLAVIPCLNEAAYIEQVATKLLEDRDTLDLAVIIADGGSRDGTLEIAQKLSRSHPEITVLRNEKRIQSAALNQAVKTYGAGREYLIRVDAHCEYPDNYCSRLVDVQRKIGADSVVVSMIAEGHKCFQRAVAAAQNSRLGNGGSAHRTSGTGKFVDHGHHALMRIDAFEAAGGYDESFSHNEDAELDARLRLAGFQIYLSGDAPVTYFPRRTPGSLFRQYMNYGRGRAKTLIKHRKRPRPRQSLPLAVAPAAALALLSPVQPVFAIPAFLWASLCIVYGCALGLRIRNICAASSGAAAMIMHFGWSIGFLSEALNLVASKGSGEQPSSLSFSSSPHPKAPAAMTK